ncbi:hypothetical protein PHMEG_00018030 [Phytophthora megakarya]|uniref:Uncharacterized protein n=1 Tax=Phytophthora megakarya TaxID=4795 RepID=A0A225VV38_9STRA|nr:hypothetical protein PHMEG_00018030 [Phytophthora megakarya]
MVTYGNVSRNFGIFGKFQTDNSSRDLTFVPTIPESTFPAFTIHFQHLHLVSKLTGQGLEGRCSGGFTEQAQPTHCVNASTDRCR